MVDICVVQTPRDCDDYWSEFRHCKSLWNRFHHYYAYGTLPSCHQWKEDYKNCREWEKHRTPTAKVVPNPKPWPKFLTQFRMCKLLSRICLTQNLKWTFNFTIFAACPADEWEKSGGRAKKVHTSMDDEERPSQWLAYATNPGKASGLLNCCC